MNGSEVFIVFLFKLYLFAISIWASYHIGKISGIEEVKRIWGRYKVNECDKEG